MQNLFSRVVTSGANIVLFSAFTAACGESITTEAFVQDEDSNSPHSLDISIHSESHEPLLIDLGEIQSDGGVDYSLWNDSPEIVNLGSYSDERKLNLSVTSGDINEVVLSSFQLGEDGQPRSVDTIDCNFETSDSQGCILTQEGDQVIVSVELPSPSYATLQVVVENRAGGLPPQQSTWLL